MGRSFVSNNPMTRLSQARSDSCPNPFVGVCKTLPKNGSVFPIIGENGKHDPESTPISISRKYLEIGRMLFFSTCCTNFAEFMGWHDRRGPYVGSGSTENPLPPNNLVAIFAMSIILEC
jgi:hypothetical protein